MSTPVVLAEGNFLIPDATFLAELVAFALILAVIWKFVVPPLQKSMTARQEAIKKSFDDADAAKQRLADAEAEYKKAIAEARAEQAKAREDAAATRREIIDGAKEEAQAEAAAILSRANQALATLPASDPLFDQIVFSRGRFLVRVTGGSDLVLPSWPEPARLIEECRG